MRTRYWLCFLALALVATLFHAQGFTQEEQQSAMPARNYVEGELLVKLRKNRRAQSVSRVHEQIGAEVAQDFSSFIGWQQVRLPKGMSVEEGMARYREMPEVESVEPNYIYKALATPNDPTYPQLYGMAKIQAPAAWDLTMGSATVVVADIDLGVDYNHEDLAANMWHNPGEIAGNNIDDDGNGYVDDVYGVDTINHDSNPIDDGGHGTHTSGTIGAVGNNSKGVVGVNWNVRIMAIKSHDAAGNGSSASVVEAFQYVTMMRQRGTNVRVTSSSWGGAPEAASYDQALKDAIDAAGNAGILNVMAAGNSNSNNDATPFYPATYNSPSIISVAASDQSDNKASFSSYGVTTVDLAAPGVGITSTYPNNQYVTFNGTSMATPHVSGAAALLSAYNPALSAASLKATLLNTVDALPQWSGKVLTGGRLNVLRALQNQTVCVFNLSSSSQTFTYNGGSSSFNITAPTNCGWAAVSHDSFISVNGTSIGSSDGAINFTVAQNNGNTSRTGTITLGDQTFTVTQNAQPTASPANISGQITTTGGAPLGGVVLTLNGAPVSAKTITDSSGNYTFTNLPTGVLYTVTPSLANYAFNPANRSFTLDSNRTDAAFTATQGAQTANALDTTEFFVRQHYLDFLGREPDQGGLDYWSSQINQCNNDLNCSNSHRTGVSAAFFIEQEFQDTGFFVYRLYTASFGQQPTFAQFVPDRNQVVGGANLEAGKQSLANDFVSRAPFKTVYPDTMSNTDFVNKLFDTAGLVPYTTERQQQIAAMNSNGKTRAQVLRDVIEIQEFKTRQYNPAFVRMQYFGYLRRDPDAGGEAFWLDVLNNREPNNYLGMVCSFITSAEYQKRFSLVGTHSNAECR